jgi:hypothetical protein
MIVLILMELIMEMKIEVGNNEHYLSMIQAGFSRSGQRQYTVLDAERSPILAISVEGVNPASEDSLPRFNLRKFSDETVPTLESINMVKRDIILNVNHLAKQCYISYDDKPVEEYLLEFEASELKAMESQYPTLLKLSEQISKGFPLFTHQFELAKVQVILSPPMGKKVCKLEITEGKLLAAERKVLNRYIEKFGYVVQFSKDEILSYRESGQPPSLTHLDAQTREEIEDTLSRRPSRSPSPLPAR